MMASKYSPIVAMLFLAGAEIAAPSTARSEEARATTLDNEAAPPMRVRCFMALTSDTPRATYKISELYRSWFCMPEEPPARLPH